MKTNFTRAEHLIAFYEATTPIVRLIPWVLTVSFVTFVALGGTPALLPIAEIAFKIAMAAISAAFFLGLPWLAGRGYKIMAAEKRECTKANELRMRAFIVNRR